jgi:hypothetical protein
LIVHRQEVRTVMSGCRRDGTIGENLKVYRTVEVIVPVRD